MTNNEESISQLEKFCDDLEKELNVFADRLTKIIAVKRSSSGVVAGEDSAKSQANLEQIGSKLQEILPTVGRLHRQILEHRFEQKIPSGKTNKSELVPDVGKQLLAVLTGILASGDWESSLFLKVEADRLKEFSGQVGTLLKSDEPKLDIIARDVARPKPQFGYSQVFILLYQIDGANLQNWYSNIKNLGQYSVTRPAYIDERYAQEFIRSKVANIERNGYVVANVKSDDFYQEGEKLFDPFGHELVSLKDKAVLIDNVVEFVHANKRRYAISDNKLVLLGEVDANSSSLSTPQFLL